MNEGLGNAYAVILAGGKGERFWPLSTSRRPKQLLSLVGGEPLLEMAVRRVQGLIAPERVFVITSADLVDATRAIATELPGENVIGEPVGRDTAAACVLGNSLVKARSPHGALCILTADQVMGDIDLFRATLSEGFSLVMSGDILMTIGIRPAYASTGFGYIEAGDAVNSRGTVSFVKAIRFVEKPDRATAEAYCRSGRFFWNSGMFVWSVTSFRRALGRHVPALAEAADRIEAAALTPDLARCVADEYSKLPRISVDYAIMEKADNIVMAKGEFAWDDVGSWRAIAKHFDQDGSGNTLIGKCEAIDSSGNIVMSDAHLTALVGVQDLVVIHTGKATLVCHKDKAEQVKKLVQHLLQTGKYNEVL